MQPRRVPIVGGDIAHYRRRGAGDPVLFVHGLTDSASSWHRVQAALGSYYDYVAYDLRGHGRSARTPGAYAFAHHVEDLQNLIVTLDLAPATVIGHSLGAEVAMSVQASRPELIGSLVAIDPPWLLDLTNQSLERRTFAAESWQKWLRTLKAGDLEAAIRYGHDEMPHWAASDIAAWAEAKMQCELEVIDYVLSPRPRWQTVVASLTCRSFLIAGDDRRGSLVSSEMLKSAKALVPSLRTARIANAGHGVFRDSFAAFMDELKQFLRPT